MKYFIVLFIFLLLTPVVKIFAGNESQHPVITVINPVRGNQLGLEQVDLFASFKGQWGVVKKEKIRATWLWQFSALENKQLIDYAKSEMKNQEHGIFLELDKNFAQKADIPYRGKGPWYHSDGLLLVSYEQFERRKFIDTVFEKFHTAFGYYPKSVGAWWVGADAINYMHEKYGVIAVLQCTDQYATDAYSIWGTPWSIPYIPSKYNAAIPAQTFSGAQDNTVIMQWATRDPLRAYGNSVEQSTFSVQDYALKKYDVTYYTYLTHIYLKKPLDQIVIGLEGGLSPEAYTANNEKQMELAKAWEKENKVTIMTASEYAKAFLERGKILPETKYFLANDYKTSDQSFWFHSPYYRVAIQNSGDTVSLVDFRDYSKTASEDFSILPNTQGLLRINTASIIDSVRFPEQKISLGKAKDLKLKEESGKVLLQNGEKTIAIFSDNKTEFPTLRNNQVVNKTFSSQHRIQVPIVILLIGTLLYSLWFLTIYKKNRIVLFSGITLLFLFLGCAIPFITNGNIFSDAVLIDSRFVNSLQIFSGFPLTPELKVLFTYQILPLIFIFGIHALLFRSIKNIVIIYTVSAIFAILILIWSSDLQQTILQVNLQSKKTVLFIFFLIALLIGIMVLLIRIYTKKRYQLYLGCITGLFILFALSQYHIFLHSKNAVITPFEMQVLAQVAQQKEQVVYIEPEIAEDVERYRSIRPLFNTDKNVTQWLSGKSWQQLSRKQVESGALQKNENTIILVPVYRGALLYHDEIDTYKLKKIADNAQIETYEIK
jgi:hypothetical protein